MDNSIPALERTLEVLEVLFNHPDGIGAMALAKQTGVPRTTLYRILRILLARGYVVQANAAGDYVLGHTLARMASGVPMQHDIASVARPVMEALSAELQETVKLVVREGHESFTIAVAQTRLDDRVASRVGVRVPLNIGASQRLLLSRAPQEIRDYVLSRPLVRWGPGSFTDARELRKNLEKLATREWDQGRDEGIRGVATVAALVNEHRRAVRAAMAVVYIADGKSEREITRMREALLRATRSLLARSEVS